MSFLLKSDFQPTGDQPQAINALVQGVNEGKPHQTLLGVTGSGKTFTVANVIAQTQKPTLVISHNKTLAAQLYQEFRDFFPHNAVSYFVSYYDYYQPEAYLPATDTYIAKETQINDEIDKLRLSATTQLLTRPDVIVVASVSCIYNLGSPIEYGQYILELIEGQLIDRQDILLRLTDMQYHRNDFELKRGFFSVKGETISVWPAEKDKIVNLNFLDNQLELITIGDDPVKRVTLFPAKHYLTNPITQTQAVKQIKTDLQTQLNNFKANHKVVEAYRLQQKVSNDLEMIESLGYVNGIENYSRYFDGRDPGQPPFSLLDYFKFNTEKFSTNGFLTIIDESHISLPQLRAMYHGDQSRKKTLIEYGFRLPSALDNRPLTYSEFQRRTKQTIYTSATPDDLEISLSGNQVVEQLIRPTGLTDPKITIKPSRNQIPDLIKEIIIRHQRHERTLITTLTKKTAEALTEYINQKTKNSKLKVQYLHADVHTLDRSDILADLRKGVYDVLVGINLLREGLDLPEVSLVAILDADKAGFLRSSTSLIQTMGRAARHLNGEIYLYADKTTPAMKAAVKEVSRRRQIQLNYNQKYHISPRSINKPFRLELISRLKPALPQPIDLRQMTPLDKQTAIRTLTRQMNQAAKNMDFEQAALLRDKIIKLQN
ncbi:excinuclease ABC subunit B [Candidatus Beckwithbacteria bacterium CG2_30_44_31]|uniref:UvrABC system protein B n=1 Tax=Candidatus Beckwithbacteria bacterium CG2_30_44_31 TaxID=1805035 RepID=A0A1J5AYL1_9BACT|nr:MAG: excinuclease ABC subunit B [Candidatus Beckwithbacteria bacterium CG2_30_44_31]